MPPALKPSVEVVPSGASVRLLDHASGRFLELTAEEGTVVALYDGVCTPAELAKKAEAEGLHWDAPHVAALLSRVRNAGLMAGPAPSAAPKPASASPSASS